MRWASFVVDDSVHAGLVEGDEVIDLVQVDGSFAKPLSSILGQFATVSERIEEIVASGAGRRALETVKLTAPVQPTKFFAIGLNYADHIAETGQKRPEALTVFAKAVSCVIGPYDNIERPIVSDQLDYEGELGIVIGQRCRHVPAARASEVIAGYLIVNDVSVRDWQVMTPQWSLGKSFDTHGPIGPWITSADSLDPHQLEIRTWVNGELRQHSNTRQLIFNCFDQIEILSKVCTLEPGDVIATGTPSGVALAREGQPWLVPGDCVRVEIEELGAIDNTVVQGALDPTFAAPVSS